MVTSFETRVEAILLMITHRNFPIYPSLKLMELRKRYPIFRLKIKMIKPLPIKIMKAKYMLNYGKEASSIGEESISLHSKTFLKGITGQVKRHEFVLKIQNYAIEQIEISLNNSTQKVTCTKS